MTEKRGEFTVSWEEFEQQLESEGLKDLTKRFKRKRRKKEEPLTWDRVEQIYYRWKETLEGVRVVENGVDIDILDDLDDLDEADYFDL